MKISLEKIVITAIMSALIVVGALVSIPIPGLPPIVLSNFFSLMAGFLLGPQLGALSVTVYLVLGFLGLPVFASGGSGFATLLGPTGGYLIGFLLMAIFAGLLRTQTVKAKGKDYLQNVLVGVGAFIILYLVGTPWFALLTERSLWDAAMLMQPYFYKDIILGALAGSVFTFLFPHLHTLIGSSVTSEEEQESQPPSETLPPSEEPPSQES